MSLLSEYYRTNWDIFCEPNSGSKSTDNTGETQNSNAITNS